MKFLKHLTFLTLILTILSCSTPKEKTGPEHTGVDPQVKEFLTEYAKLASAKGIVFKRLVTMGFSPQPGITIGVCYWGKRWREIDFDPAFWKNASYLTKKMLVFHELTHCYCSRDHDFAEGKPYNVSLLQKFFHLERRTSENGYYDEDGCPISIMHPTIVPDGCAVQHYNHYLTEMFDRCDPW